MSSQIEKNRMSDNFDYQCQLRGLKNIVKNENSCKYNVLCINSVQPFDCSFIWIIQWAPLKLLEIILVLVFMVYSDLYIA
jgi:hypothetical protein